VVQLGAIAEYVDKKPGGTPVYQPTKFDLVIDFMIAMGARLDCFDLAAWPPTK
jgi:hypothetical protein